MITYSPYPLQPTVCKLLTHCLRKPGVPCIYSMRITESWMQWVNKEKRSANH